MIPNANSRSSSPPRAQHYSAATGRGAIGGINDDDELFGIESLPGGTFATDWTAIA